MRLNGTDLFLIDRIACTSDVHCVTTSGHAQSPAQQLRRIMADSRFHSALAEWKAAHAELLANEKLFAEVLAGGAIPQHVDTMRKALNQQRADVDALLERIIKLMAGNVPAPESAKR